MPSHSDEKRSLRQPRRDELDDVEMQDIVFDDTRTDNAAQEENHQQDELQVTHDAKAEPMSSAEEPAVSWCGKYFLAASDEGEEGSGTHRAATIWTTTINMLCNVIGAGVLVLPSAFDDSSLVFGLILLVLTAAVTTTNIYFLVECAEFTQTFSYCQLLRRAFGSVGAAIVEISIIVACYGALVAYCRIVADIMPPIMANYLSANGFWVDESTWLLFGGITFFLLSCRRTLSEMMLSSVVGILTIYYAEFLVIWRYVDDSYAGYRTPSYKWLYFQWNAFRTIPVIAFALSVHQNAPSFYEEMADRKPRRMYIAVAISHAFIVSSYAAMGVFGLLTFGSSIRHAMGNVLDAYRVDDSLINSARLGMFAHFACVYPLMQMAVRRSLNNLFFKTNNLPFALLCLETLLLVISSALVAAIMPNVEDIVDLSTSICGSILMMIAPSYLYLTVRPHGEKQGEWKWRCTAWTSIAFGAFTGVFGMFVTIAKWSSSNPEE